MATPPQGPSVLVMGAGSMGCWLGGHLQAAGVVVHFVGRPRMLAALARHGLTLTDRDGGRLHLAADRLQLHRSLPADLTPDLVLLCVNSAATATAAVELGGLLPPGTPVVSMQNGIANAAIAQSAAPQLVLLPGMVATARCCAWPPACTPWRPAMPASASWCGPGPSTTNRSRAACCGGP